MSGEVKDAAPLAERPGAQKRAPHSSVVYFHGMGSQRRYEESSRLVDCLDKYLVRQHESGNSVGMLSKIRVRVEALRGDPKPKGVIGYVDDKPILGASQPEGIIGYIRTIFSKGDEPQPPIAVRFYEVYWAPIMADNKSAWGVAKWLLKQPVRPWRTLRAPWRERQRLRRASLVALFERHCAKLDKTAKDDYASLIELYDKFERLDAQRRFPRGTFQDFLCFIAEQLKTDSKPRSEAIKRRIALARDWFSAYRRQELRNAFALGLIVLTLVLLAGGVLFGILVVLHSILAFRPLADLLKQFDAPLKADWKTVSAIAAALVSLVGIGKFLTDYLGDVEAWATYEETDIKYVARNKVLDRSLEVLTHVLCDPNCERVTVVAHSLGSSVAHDALLALTRRNLAYKSDDPIAGPVPMNKIEHFVTMGSPVDKIEYFFESYSSPSHRFKRVIEALRGDIGAPPFTRNERPHIHWINFWDQGDAISGALHSPASADGFDQRVDNVHVANYGFPIPGASHSGYFEHRTVIDTLFRVIYRRASSFCNLTQPAPNKPYDYQSVYLGPGEPLGTRSAYVFLAAVTPLLVLVGVIAVLLDLQVTSYAAWGLAALAGILLFLGYLVCRLEGQQNAI
jgi:hypothetical protein